MWSFISFLLDWFFSITHLLWMILSLWGIIIWKMRRTTEGLTYRVYLCWFLKGDLTTYAKSIIKIWSKRFWGLLNDGDNETTRDDKPDFSMNCLETDVLLADYEEVRISIARLKSNKATRADGLPNTKNWLDACISFFTKHSRTKSSATFAIYSTCPKT